MAGATASKIRVVIQCQARQQDGFDDSATAAVPRRRGNGMRRRKFIALIGGVAAAATGWPRAARAQREQKRRVAVLMGGLSSGDANGQAEAGALEDALQERGWRQGGNIEIT